jgi:kynurenine formamidase
VPTISYSRVVDLTYALVPGIPVWPGDPAVERKSIARRDRDGYNLHALSLGEHSGTHLGAPSHLVPEGRMLHEIPAGDLVLPAVVFDMRREAEAWPDFQLRPEHVEAWEQQHGKVPEGSAALLLTGWQSRWRDEAAFLGRDAIGNLHFPGFGTDTTTLLVQQRRVKGLGTDTAGIDPAMDRTFSANRILLGAGGFHLECLANLDQLPPAGATLVVGALKIAGGSGSPARVLALV